MQRLIYVSLHIRMTRCCDELLCECFGEIISSVIGYREETGKKRLLQQSHKAIRHITDRVYPVT